MLDAARLHRAAAARAPASGPAHASSSTPWRSRASTRPDAKEASPDVRKYVSWGAGPRASQYLVLGAKARAAMDGRAVPDLDDVRSVAHVVLRHRIVLNFQAEAEGMTPERLIRLEER